MGIILVGNFLLIILRIFAFFYILSANNCFEISSRNILTHLLIKAFHY